MAKKGQASKLLGPITDFKSKSLNIWIEHKHGPNQPIKNKYALEVPWEFFIQFVLARKQILP